VAGGVPIAFSSPTFNGTLTTSVISGDLNNGALGGLTFVYELTNNITSLGQIDRVTINSFTGYNTDVGFVLPGVAPGINDRSASGDVIGFTFVGAPLGIGVLLPNQSSSQLVVRTDASLFQITVASIIDGSATTVTSFSPASHNIPEPSTFMLALFAAVVVFATAVRARADRPQAVLHE
jgi:hypothetical protein